MMYHYLNLEHLPIKHHIALTKLDQKAINDGIWQDYSGIGYFWNDLYKFTCRELTPSKRKQLLRELIDAELIPSDATIEHTEIVAKYNRWVDESKYI